MQFTYTMHQNKNQGLLKQLSEKRAALRQPFYGAFIDIKVIMAWNQIYLNKAK